MLIRGLVALVSGWLTAGVGVALLLQLSPREHMGLAAGGAVLVGLVVAVLVWRATRFWGRRRVTDREMSDGFAVHLSPQFTIAFALLSAASCGIMAVYLWRQCRRWPARVDPEGMTLRSGRRLPWREVTDVRHVATSVSGLRFTQRWELRGEGVDAVIVPHSLAEGAAVLEFASRGLGRDLRPRRA